MSTTELDRYAAEAANLRGVYVRVFDAACDDAGLTDPEARAKAHAQMAEAVLHGIESEFKDGFPQWINRAGLVAVARCFL